jgi:16S rRNA (guanine(966)-N(2))-methyltransferase RsmD
MRVIAGIYKGRKLDAPPGNGVRPTAEKVKEALFSMLASLMSPEACGGTPLEGKACLDLFAGTGALGIEALSRGAASCVFVESNPAAAKVLEGNVARTARREAANGRAAPAPRVIRSDWRPALLRLNDRVDIAFIDPPYDAGYYDEVMKTLLDCDIISDGGLAVIERSSSGNDPKRGAGRRARAVAGGIDIIETYQGSLSGRYAGFDLIRERRYGKTLIEVYERT